MKAIIIGCGRLGSAIALELYRKGNEVTVIDKDPDSFALLGSEFNGNTIVGIGFDKEVMEEAGIQFQDAVICTTDSDEVNVLAGKIAKDIFMVPLVVARLYDPRKAKIFESLGIKTISTTGYGVDRAIELLSYDKMDSVSLLGAKGDTEFVRIHATANVEGAMAKELSKEGEYALIAIVRGKTSFLPSPEEIIRTDDILYFAVDIAKKPKLKVLLGI